MGLQLESQIGPATLADSQTETLIRKSRQNALVTTDAHGRYVEAVARGNTYALRTAIGGATIAAAGASPLAANTGAPVLGIINPSGSGKNANVLSIIWEHVSGTPAAGSWSWDEYISPATTSQTGTAPTNLLTGRNVGSVMVGLVAQATTATVAAAVPKLLVPMGAFAGAIAATAANLAGQWEPAGLITVAPGAIGGLAHPGAGTSHIIAVMIVWEEIAV